MKIKERFRNHPWSMGCLLCSIILMAIATIFMIDFVYSTYAYFTAPAVVMFVLVFAMMPLEGYALYHKEIGDVEYNKDSKFKLVRAAIIVLYGFIGMAGGVFSSVPDGAIETIFGIHDIKTASTISGIAFWIAIILGISATLFFNYKRSKVSPKEYGRSMAIALIKSVLALVGSVIGFIIIGRVAVNILMYLYENEGIGMGNYILLGGYILYLLLYLMFFALVIVPHIIKWFSKSKA